MEMLRVHFDNENVYVSYGAGDWEVQPLNNSWLQLIGCLENGKMIAVKDEREVLQDHQHHMSFVRNDQLNTDRAIAHCEELLKLYDANMEVTDLDICHIIEILKGRE